MTSRAWYLVAAGAFLAGIGLGGWLVWSGLAGLETALVRVVVPGSAVLTLDEPGTYTIFHETQSVVRGRLYASQNIAGLQVSVTEEADGQAIPVVEPTGNAKYSIGGHEGVSVLAFDIVQPGRYRLSAAYDGGRTEPAAVLAVSIGFFKRLLGMIFGAIGVAFSGVIVGLVIAVITFLKRQRLKRRQQRATMPMGGY